MPEQANPKIDIDGKSYYFLDLPQDVQNMVVLYNEWKNELIKMKNDCIRNEAAMIKISTDIGTTMKKNNDGLDKLTGKTVEDAEILSERHKS